MTAIHRQYQKRDLTDFHSLVHYRDYLSASNHASSVRGLRPGLPGGRREEWVIEKLLRQREGEDGPEIELKWKGWLEPTWQPRSEML